MPASVCLDNLSPMNFRPPTPSLSRHHGTAASAIVAVVFAQCRELNEVILSRRLPAVVRSHKFWRWAFGRALYALSYEETKKQNGEETPQASLLAEARVPAGEGVGPPGNTRPPSSRHPDPPPSLANAPT